jgi:hypothetical protein
MNWFSINVGWAEPGVIGMTSYGERFFMFVVIESTVNGANVLVLDTDVELCAPGTVEWIPWNAQLWQVSKIFVPYINHAS